MKSRRWIGTVLITLVVIAVLAAAGCALYRFGYSRGAIAANAGEGFMMHDFEDMPFFGGAMGEGFMFHDFEDMPFAGQHMGQLPPQFQDRSQGPNQRFNPGQAAYGHMFNARSHFSAFTFVLRVLFLGLIVWVLYKFITLFTGGKSWQLSFNSQGTSDPEEDIKPKSRARAK
ncbi:MAG: hypothetical protein E4G99_13020 [Anaerolineales bacterium]|nr:MAG: hypothetical protein E4G99_13020 [Anaerolineales bacterium]